jgi:hypothetical protein
MEQLHILDGDPPEDDLTPVLLGASHYFEIGDVLGLLECIGLLAFQMGGTSSTALLDPAEASALAQIETFQREELQMMHQTLASSELACSAFFLDMAGVHACCRASEFRQRRRMMEILSGAEPNGHWTLGSEWAHVRRSGEAVFQASAVFVGWLHQRFELHYLARDPTDNLIPSPADNESLRPYVLRALPSPSGPRVRRTRLAGWRCDQAVSKAVCATLLAVPALRNSQNMVKALQDAITSRSGPFIRRPAADKGVFVTELVFESLK